MQSEVNMAVVTPSPFETGESAEVTVAVHDGQVILTRDERSVVVRPSRAVMGHGTVRLTIAEPPGRLVLRFGRYDAPALIRQHSDQLARLYATLQPTGMRELLVALRDSGVPLRTSPAIRRGAGGHRANAWIGASALLFVELALFGLPAAMISALASGALTTGHGVVTALLIAGFAGFLVLAVAASPVPLIVRAAFTQAATRDPIRYFDTWSGQAGQGAVRAGEQREFVPGRPVWSAAILLVVLAFYASQFLHLRFPDDTAGAEAATPTGKLDAPVPDWLDGDAIALLGYAAMTLLLVIFAIGLVQWRQDPELYRIRWAPLVGAFFGFAFGQAGPGLRLDSGLEIWLQVVLIAMIVAFTCGRVGIGIGVFAAMAVFVLLVAFATSIPDRQLLLVVLLPVSLLITAILIRYLPGGSRLVVMPVERALAMRRIVRWMWGIAVVLGVGLVVAGASLIQPAG